MSTISTMPTISDFNDVSGSTPDNKSTLGNQASNKNIAATVTNNIIQLYPLSYAGASAGVPGYPLCEPKPDDSSDSDSSTGHSEQYPSATEVISPFRQSIDLYDEMCNVTAVRYFLYEAVESMFEEDQGCIASSRWPQSYFGLCLFLDWVRKRDLNIKKEMDKLCQSLGSAENNSKDKEDKS